jgi:voltage-gated potassium channel
VRQADDHTRAARRSLRRHLRRTLLICALLVVAYYLVPVEPGAGGGRLVVRWALVAAALLAVTALVVRLAAHLVRREPGTWGASLLVALVGGVVLFALIDYLVAVSRPDQFHDLRTKTDALYFAVTTLATVGYGDVHATGQLARVVVTVQQVYNLVVITTGATTLARQLASRAGR